MLLSLGKIIHEHGIKGYVKFQLYNPASQMLRKNMQGWLQKDDQKRKVLLQDLKSNDTLNLLKFDFINNPELARQWRQAEFLVDPSLYENLQEGEDYLHDLIGFQVFDEAKLLVGTLMGYQEQKGIEWFVIKDIRGDSQLIPWLDDTVQKVDRVQKTMELKLPEGLIDLWKSIS